nr:putative ribonuclease H-like domain-containing protein [Tanacetum cinerariifolium]
MGDKHLDTIPATKSNEFIKSYVENLVPHPSESQGENGCDLPACFTTFSNILFDADDESDSSDYQSCSDEDFPEEIYSNPLFEEEIISIKIDQHHFNAESDLVESLLNRDSSIISSSLKIDSLLSEFIGELTLLKSIPSGIDKTDCHPKNEICLIEILLYDNSSPRPPKEEFVSENSNAEIKYFSPSPIPIEDSDSHMEEIDLPFNPDGPMPLSIENDDDDSERDVLIRDELPSNYSLSLPVNESFCFDIPSFSRPPAKPPDGDTGILNIKMMETNKALLKDEEAVDVDVHLYRSMIGSLMCLTASRPDIMFVVYACARFQVTPKVSHLHVVKRIFRYLKGQPKLSLWYARDSPFDMEAFSDSDYAGASLDRKSPTRGC